MREDHLHKTELAATLEEHRAQLKPGEECPLCGSLDHPWSERHQPSISMETIAEEVRQAKAELEAAELEARAAEHAVTRIDLDVRNLIKENRRHCGGTRGCRKADDLDSRRIWNRDGEPRDADRRCYDDRCADRGTARRSATDSRSSPRSSVERDERLRLHGLVETATAVTISEKRTVDELTQQMNEQEATIADLKERIAGIVKSLQDLLAPYNVPVPEIGSEQRTLIELTVRKEAYQHQSEICRGSSLTLERTLVELQRIERSLDESSTRAEAYQQQQREFESTSEQVDPGQNGDGEFSWTTANDVDNVLGLLENEAMRNAATLLDRREALAQSEARLAEIGTQCAARLAGSPSKR